MRLDKCAALGDGIGDISRRKEWFPVSRAAEVQKVEKINYPLKMVKGGHVDFTIRKGTSSRLWSTGK